MKHTEVLRVRARLAQQLPDAAEIVRGDARNACCIGVRLDQLPHNFLSEALARHPVGAIHGPENVTLRHACWCCPRINCELNHELLRPER